MIGKEPTWPDVPENITGKNKDKIIFNSLFKLALKLLKYFIPIEAIDNVDFCEVTMGIFFFWFNSKKL